MLLGGQAQLLGGERLGSGQELVQHVAVSGLESAPFGRAEPVVRQVEVADDIEGLAHALELLLETGGQGAER
jgi:hypothetical protein